MTFIRLAATLNVGFCIAIIALDLVDPSGHRINLGWVVAASGWFGVAILAR